MATGLHLEQYLDSKPFFPVLLPTRGLSDALDLSTDTDMTERTETMPQNWKKMNEMAMTSVCAGKEFSRRPSFSFEKVTRREIISLCLNSLKPRI